MTAPTFPGFASPPPAEPAVEPAAEAPASPGPGRDLYLDLLRALALFRVVLLHTFDWFWLPIVFPSMGVMFALAGSLMARSLARPALSVIRGRLRRLLPPMWLFGLIVVPGMMLQGWTPAAGGNPVGWWGKLAFWILPLADPPFAARLPGVHGFLDAQWGEHAAGPLWYLRAYLWFVLLSPLLLAALRQLPWLVLPVPMLLCLTLDAGVVNLPDALYSILNEFCIYGSCWLLGMAYQEGLLKRIPRYVVPSVVPFVMAAVLWWALHRTTDSGAPATLEDTAAGQAVWSFGFVLLLLNAGPSWTSWPPRLQRWSGLIGLLNSRAVTVYLWHNLAITAAIGLLEVLRPAPLVSAMPWLVDNLWLAFVLSWPLIGLCILLFGWIEDVAAKRRPRLFPYPRALRAAHRR